MLSLHAQVVEKAFSKDELSDKEGVKQCYVAAVLDGHGMLGEMVAEKAGHALVEDTCARAKKNGCNLLMQPPDKLKGALASAFEQAHQASLAVYDDPPSCISYPYDSLNKARYTLYRPNGLPVYRPDASCSRVCGDRLLECGTTCTMAVVQGDRLCIANVGDSAAALVSLSDGDVEAHFITTDHNGRNKNEAERITQNHSTSARISDDRGYLSVFAGMWAGLELSVTRALGHKHLEAHGVLCEPAVRSLSLQSEDTCLIIASDGVWDVMDAREAANRVMDVISGGGTAEEAARQLVRDTVMLAECSPDGDADNTSAVVLVFE
eukprot:GHRQ01019398.1.p1 GENE.GHRQ01019398.1~~GHRQ01019398.1.p1  ORF type:complete len:322 (+),score=115.03 GHRQ01019398.1:568-1533(+)